MTIDQEIKSIEQHILKINHYNNDNTCIALSNSNINWLYISERLKLSEAFIKKFSGSVRWYSIARYQKLSESFIREFKDKVNWHIISKYQELSETFIRDFQDMVDWYMVSTYQKLSETFIREFKGMVNWYSVTERQKLSEKFLEELVDFEEIRELENREKNNRDEQYISLIWRNISRHQKLSIDFIRRFKDKLYWYYISINQKLSENFIREFRDRVYWSCIPKYQKLTPEFIKEFRLEIPSSNWLYKSKEEKLNCIKNNTEYKIIDNKYIIAYKSTRYDGYSVYNFQYKYEVGKTYESSCNPNDDQSNSFGLSAWTREKALNYYSKGKLFKVRICIDDLGCIVKYSHKIRCFKLKILEEIKF